jgi:hypothetical protein
MTGSAQIDPGQLPERVEALPGIDALREVAERVPAYLVGGAVRDLLLGLEGGDLDVAIEGDADMLADLPGFEVEREGLFLTGRLHTDDLRLDVAQARAETYPRPGGLPEVRPATISEDLARRDFTINAMAFPLAADDQLLDPHGGLEDLRSELLRVLHPRSFVDDPTRALRAARYAARFGLELEPETDRLLRESDLSTVSDDRVQNERWDPAQLVVARALGAQWLDRYAAEWRRVRLEITGDDLLEAGVPEGPAIGRGLEAALSGKLDGELSGRDDELRIALAAARGEIPED